MKSFLIACVLLLLMVAPVSAQAAYDVMLTGVDHVPPVRTPALGSVEVWVESDTLFVRGSFENLRDNYWAAHIHYGERGKTGNRLFRLHPQLNEDKRGGQFNAEENRFHLRQAQRDALRSGHLYIVISSNRFQQGEIRGQVPPM